MIEDQHPNREHPGLYSELDPAIAASARTRGREEIARLETRYRDFIAAMRNDYDELVGTRRLSKAQELSAATGQHFNAVEFPMFFTGDLDAEIILVHLNPKGADKRDQEFYEGEFRSPSFEEYFDLHAHFGEYAYGRLANGAHYSRFDAKQVRFLRPFGLIAFEDGNSPEARLVNLERAIDRKLQMELVPYGSEAFSTKGFTAEVLRPHLDRLLGVVSAVPRRFVLFCGSVFAPILNRFVTQLHEFYLPTSKGTDKQKSRFGNLRIPYEGQEIRAGLAHSWPRQGIPMTAYGTEIAARY